MKTTTGTQNFVTKSAAIRYYRNQGDDVAAVEQKIKEKLIEIGMPKVKPGERLLINWGEGRYFIQS